VAVVGVLVVRRKNARKEREDRSMGRKERIERRGKESPPY
jgi:hypothetical protein